MNAKKFSDAMNELDSKYIEEAAAYGNEAKPRFYRRRTIALIAAAAVVVLIGCAAAGVFGTWVIDFFRVSKDPADGSFEAGYDLGAAVKKIPVDSLKGEISQAGETIRQQRENYSPASSLSPDTVRKEFSSSEEARAYIGLEGLKTADLGMEEKETTLIAAGDEQGEISYVELETNYNDFSGDKLRAWVYTYIYTEKYDGDIMTGVRTTEDLEFTESFYTTAQNNQCQIIDSTPMESGYRSTDGYLVEDGILYNIHLAYKEKDAEKAQELVRKWADQY